MKEKSEKEYTVRHLVVIRQQLVDRLWFSIFLIALVGAPLSVSRFIHTGWLNIYNFHILLAIVCVLMYFKRKNISYRVKTIVLLGLFFAVGAAGLFIFGLLGAGIWWLVVLSFILSTLYSLRAGIILAGFNVLLIGVAGYLFLNGIIRLPISANEYVNSISSWLSFLTAAFIMPLLVFQSVAIFQSSTDNLLLQIEDQRKQIKKLAMYDQLTGLLLLNMASERLEHGILRAKRSGKKLALLFIDIDGFKEINDTHGHEAGDCVLIEIANRFSNLKREEDSTARIGGDEFVIVMENISDAKEAAVIAQRYLLEIAVPIKYLGEELNVTGSIGIAIYPDHALEGATLRKAADHAMYTVKKDNRNGYAFANEVQI